MKSGQNFYSNFYYDYYIPDVIIIVSAFDPQRYCRNNYVKIIRVNALLKIVGFVRFRPLLGVLTGVFGLQNHYINLEFNRVVEPEGLPST